jgi:hypothetical protein
MQRALIYLKNRPPRHVSFKIRLICLVGATRSEKNFHFADRKAIYGSVHR